MKTRMKQLVSIVFVAVILLVLAATYGSGSLEPSAPPGPIMKTLDEVEPRIPIPGSTTPAATFTITQSGSYYLTGDRYASFHGITVDVNDVTIDLMGYRLIGPNSGNNCGIYITGESRNVEIRNGTVRDFGYDGIYAGSLYSKDYRVIGVRAVSNGRGGITLSYGKRFLVKDCCAAENGKDGIKTGSGSTLAGNTAYDNGESGIFVQAFCTVTGNTAYDNGESGIYVDYGSTVTDNTACYNQYYGIAPGNECLVDGNTACGNNQSGVGYPNIKACGSCTFGLNHAP